MGKDKEMRSCAEDIKDYLIELFDDSSSSIDFELIFGTNLFVSVLPETTNIATVLLDTPGSPPNPNSIRNPTMQILTRGKVGGYTAAYAQMEIIADCLHGLANVTINGTKYIQMWLLGDVFHIGNDSKGRPMFSSTLQIQRT